MDASRTPSSTGPWSSRTGLLITSGGSAINYVAGAPGTLTRRGDGNNTSTSLTFAANLVGGSRTDRLVSTNNFDFNLGDTFLRRNRFIGSIYQFYGDVRLTSFESAALTGGSDANKFWFESWGGQITLNGGGGADRLLLDDALTAASTAYTVYDNRVTYPRNGKTVTVNYVNFAELTINGGTVTSTFNVESTSAATTINPGSGGGAVRVAPAGRTLDQLRGPLTVNGNGGTTLPLNDRAATGVDNDYQISDRQLVLLRYRIDPNTGVLNPFPTATRINYQNLIDLTLADASAPVNLIRVWDTGGTAQTTLDTAGSVATVLVGDSTTNPDAVGDVRIQGSPNTTVLIDDTATVPALIPYIGYNSRPTYLLTDGRVARTNVVTYSIPSNPNPFGSTHRSTISYSYIGGLEVRGGSTGTVFDVLGNSSQTTLKAGVGGDVVNAGGPESGLDGVDRLTVVGNTGTVLNLNDQATGYREFQTTPGTQTWSPKPTFRVTNGVVARTNVVSTNFVEFDFPRQQTFNTAISYSNLPRLVLNGGSSGNVFNVQYTAAGTPVDINAGAGDDVTNLGDGSNLMDGIQGPVTVDGQEPAHFRGERDGEPGRREPDRHQRRRDRRAGPEQHLRGAARERVRQHRRGHGGGGRQRHLDRRGRGPGRLDHRPGRDGEPGRGQLDRDQRRGHRRPGERARRFAGGRRGRQLHRRAHGDARHGPGQRHRWQRTGRRVQ